MRFEIKIYYNCKFTIKMWFILKFRDAIVVSISNCLTSVFAGFVVFAYMGNLAYETKQDISEVIQEGQGLSFIVFPYAVTQLSG